MGEFFEKQRKLEADMCFRHPWFNMFYNWMIAALLVALCVSFIAWGLDIRTRHKAEEMTAQALASWQADQDAERFAQEEQLRAIQESQEYIMEQEATAVAKAFYGINKFVEFYGYGEKDLETYARCMFNRAEASGDLIAEISKPEQFTGYNDGNQVVANYKQLALKLVEEWHNETVKPCDTSFVFAELTPDGIWLKQQLHADGYARRWQA